jgi:hypothetical protein
MTFSELCAKEKIQVLREDMKYIRSFIINMPKNERRSVLLNYISKWHEGINSESKSILKQNSGRRNANKWLREECIKIK